MNMDVNGIDGRIYLCGESDGGKGHVVSLASQ